MKKILLSVLVIAVMLAAGFVIKKNVDAAGEPPLGGSPVYSAIEPPIGG